MDSYDIKEMADRLAVRLAGELHRLGWRPPAGEVPIVAAAGAPGIGMTLAEVAFDELLDICLQDAFDEIRLDEIEASFADEAPR